VQGTIQTLELPFPTADEPENIEFFMEWDVPLECDAIWDCEDEEDREAEQTVFLKAPCAQFQGIVQQEKAD